jgi:tetratricopeptide (TPR) repeat protein
LLGIVYETLKRPDDALRAYERARQLEPSDTWTLYHIAQLQIQQGRKETAWETLTTALRTNPDDLSLYPALEQLAAELGRTDAYRAMLQTLAERDTPGEEPLKAYVALLQREGKVEDALALVSRRLRTKPDDTALLNLQLGLLSALGRHQQMLGVYAQLARLNPERHQPAAQLGDARRAVRLNGGDHPRVAGAVPRRARRHLHRAETRPLLGDGRATLSRH